MYNTGLCTELYCVNKKYDTPRPISGSLPESTPHARAIYPILASYNSVTIIQVRNTLDLYGIPYGFTLDHEEQAGPVQVSCTGGQGITQGPVAPHGVGRYVYTIILGSATIFSHFPPCSILSVLLHIFLHFNTSPT